MKAYLGIGTNLGDKQANIFESVRLLNHNAGTVMLQSSFYFSQAWGFKTENEFVNVVVLLETKLQPLELLRVTQDIEQQMGRIKKSAKGKYSDRIIDIDILLYEDMTIDLPELKIPHPQMKARDFVSKPLNEILGLI